MMKSIIVPIFIVVFLSGCWGGGRNVIRDVVEVPVPVAVVPNPPEVTRPILATEVLTEEQKANVGELVKAHRVALQQAITYATILERVIDVYRRLHIETKSNLELLRGPVLMGSANNTFQPVLEIPDFSDPMTYYNNIFDKLQDEIKTLEEKNYVEVD